MSKGRYLFLSLLILILSACNNGSTTSSQPLTNTNSPWYPSLEAFEHYNSGRSHVFPQAEFGGSFFGNNTINILNSVARYPSGYNMAYLNASQSLHLWRWIWR